MEPEQVLRRDLGKCWVWWWAPSEKSSPQISQLEFHHEPTPSSAPFGVEEQMSRAAPKAARGAALAIGFVTVWFCLRSCEHISPVIRDNKYLLILNLNLGLCIFNNCISLNMQIITINLFWIYFITKIFVLQTWDILQVLRLTLQTACQWVGVTCVAWWDVSDNLLPEYLSINKFISTLHLLKRKLAASFVFLFCLRSGMNYQLACFVVVFFPVCLWWVFGFFSLQYLQFDLNYPKE